MRYQFYKKKVDTTSTVYFLVKAGKGFDNLENFDFTDKSKGEIQEIIDGVEASRTKPKEDAYEWANEDVLVVSNENGVLVYDLLAGRTGVTDVDGLNLLLTHDEFIQFLTEFKEFIASNSK